MEASRKSEKPIENSNLLAVNSIVQINTENYDKDKKVMLESKIKTSMKMKKSEIVTSNIHHSSKKQHNLVINIEEPLPQTFGNPTLVESPVKSNDESIIINNMMNEKSSDKNYDPSILDMESQEEEKINKEISVRQSNKGRRAGDSFFKEINSEMYKMRVNLESGG